MKPVFANSAWVETPERFILRGGRRQKMRLRVRYGVVRHPAQGPVLIDTGYGPEATAAPGRGLALRLYSRLIAPRLLPEGDVSHVLGGMGLHPEDVRQVIVTHFHADHVAALSRFSQARFLARASALRALRRNRLAANLRHGIFAGLLPDDFAARMTDIDSLPRVGAPLGLGHGRDLLGDGSLLAIDLPGHAEGHFGLCFPRLDPPLLYAVDTQWLLGALLEDRLPGFPASLVAHDGAAAAASARRVAAFHAGGGQVVLCHDPDKTPHDLPGPDDG